MITHNRPIRDLLLLYSFSNKFLLDIVIVPFFCNQTAPVNGDLSLGVFTTKHLVPRVNYWLVKIICTVFYQSSVQANILGTLLIVKVEQPKGAL